MSLRAIRYFVAVAEHHSFTRAAELVFVSQPTLSHQVKLLEESLGIRLLDRSGRSVRLTDAGEIYLRHARRVLRELDAAKVAINDVQDLNRGFLRLAMTPITDFLIRPLLETFNERYPGITVSILELSQNQIEAALAGENDDNIDLGIVFTDTFSSAARSNDLEKLLFFVEKLTFAVGKSHPYAHKQMPMSLHELDHESLALLSDKFALRHHLDRYFHDHSISPHIALETNSVGVIVDIVRHGRLGTVLPCSLISEQAGLHAISMQPELPRHTITMICRKGAHKSAACRAFGNLAAEYKATPAATAPPDLV